MWTAVVIIVLAVAFGCASELVRSQCRRMVSTPYPATRSPGRTDVRPVAQLRRSLSSDVAATPVTA